MKKHAYLIIAHNEFMLLKSLLRSLDDERNDIYLHIDKKAGKIKQLHLQEEIKKANLFFVPRKRNRWGHISLVKCEYRLLESAFKKHYEYYHLLSGVDFPLKSQDAIHAFLKDSDREYISFHTNGYKEDWFLYKVQLYHPLLRWVGRGDAKGSKLLQKLGEWEYSILAAQEKNGVDRTKRYPGIVYYKGDQWFSITDDFVEYVLSQKKRVFKMFALTNGSDEIFMATLAMNSRFRERVENCSLRLIDWDRGAPYEYKWEDKELLEASSAFFVRKISYERDPKLVEWLANRVMPEK